MRSNFGKAESTRLTEYSAPSIANQAVEPSAETLTFSFSLHEESVFPNSLIAGAGSSISSSFEVSQGDLARDNLLPSVDTAMNIPSAVLMRHVPRYLGKSCGTDAAELPSANNFARICAGISHITSALALSGILGKVSGEMTEKRILLLPALRNPRSEFTSRTKSSASNFLSIAPKIAAGITAFPGSRTFAPFALQRIEVLRSVASSITVLSSEAIISTPAIASFADFAFANFSAFCHALRKS